MNGHTPKCRCFSCSSFRDQVKKMNATMFAIMSRPVNLAWASGLRNGAK